MKWTFEKYKDVPYVQLCSGYTCIDVLNGEYENDKNDTAGARAAKELGGVETPSDPVVKPAKKASKSDGN